MIPRAAHRLETTWLSSRQSLPRPARLYSTPSKPRNAPATATATLPTPQHDFHLLNQNANQGMANFLSRNIPLTIIPAPEPLDRKSPSFDPWFGDSQTHDMVGIVDACLHNLYDVPRAQKMFAHLRKRVGFASLTTRMYNNFLDAYLQMAEKEPHKKEYWLDEMWNLYTVLEGEVEVVAPTSKTYAIMFYRLFKYGSGIDQDTNYVLSKLVERDIPILDVLKSSYLGMGEEMADVAQMLSEAAVNLGFRNILQDLGHYTTEQQSEHFLDDVPEAMPVQATRKSESGDGSMEAYTPFNIAALRRHLNDIVAAKSVLENNPDARQEHLEASVYDLAVEQFQHSAANYTDKSPRDADLQQWIWQWHLALEKHINQVVKFALSVAEQGKMSAKASPEDRAQWALMQDILPCLSSVPTHKLSLLTILELLRLQGTSGVPSGMKAAGALIAIGRGVENEYKAEICRQAKIPVADYSIKRGNYFSNMGYKHLHERRVAAAKSQELDERWQGDWSQAMRSKVGAFLVNAFESVAEVSRTMVDPATGQNVTETQPAIYNAYEFVRGHKVGVIKFNDAVCDRISSDSLTHTIHARHLPMLVKPKPWISYKEGGYIYNKSNAMRFKDSFEQEVYLREATKSGTMELVYAGLDILGSTPWRINRSIFDVVLKVWNSGERMGKIPPAVFDGQEPVLKDGSDIQERTNFLMRHKVWSQAKANNHSDRCSVNYKIEIARAFLGDVIYMPHSLDFRGRAYPIPPHLNHIGDDLSRALLKFSEGKMLGKSGLRWLKIHAANLYGYDKANFTERVIWVDEHMDQIKEAAMNPLEGTRWWTKADDQWQFLATCMELTKAMELEDPTQYVCSLPVHQDGTCNGLQHYAALGGDIKGAQQVNLLAADRPSDVYTHISVSVQAELEKDAEAGVEMAKLLKGKITRKVVKQTVMTTVYGVTFVGAREQIERQLKDRGDIPADLCWAASSYLAKKVLNTIGDAFAGAKSIQDWLNLCARLITKSIPEKRLSLTKDEAGNDIISLPMKDIKKEQMTSVIWTTALGLPIVQPYRKVVRKQIRTPMQSIYISDPFAAAEVNSLKQASAFPPNFIHSLDATHMMLTALECRNRNLFFASVHDSYWTHACDVDKMSEVIRDTFIALHSSDILGRLEAEFRERYKDHQVALYHLAPVRSTSKFLVKLHAAGCRIYARRDQAKELEPLKDLLIFTDDKSSIATTSDSVEDLDKLIEEDAAAEEDDEDEAKAAAKEAKAKKPSEQLRLLAGKFVRLSDLIPPLPSKGTFKVEDIKWSPYFFS
ncbi:DNA/RNA polymerase [Pholiota conissans]|uniref:DNA-directed RNA polymerase n=1 Tax=Pholiota conissans TaxID=109636 RepID=A0A9P6CU19_9AGAR|nr:DNA/RNA polymerase [Pholiota conissans]